MRPILRYWLTTSSVLAAIAIGALTMNPAVAQECGQDYEVVRGDSLSKIAAKTYDDPQKWSVIYGVNTAIIGLNPDLIDIGQVLRIPCLDKEAAPEPEETPVEQPSESVAPSVSASASTIKFLTADDYAPFTDRNLINEGLVTDIVVSALKANSQKPDFRIDWVNDWSAHLDPLLTKHVYDLGFPWLRPACENTPDDYRCQNFLFSNPMFEMLVLLFVDESRSFPFSSDDDIAGKTLCRPEGYYTHDLEKDGRLWLTDNKITLEQPDSVDECFRMLTEGSVDAVALNEFTGRSAIHRLSLGDTVVAVDTRPLSIEGLHVVVHKTHPNANSLISLVNDSVAELLLSGEFETIVDNHLTDFWSKIQ